MGVFRRAYDAVWAFLYKMASPRHFYRLANKLIPWLGIATLLLMAHGLYGGFFVAPPDYQQGESYRIIFIHVERVDEYVLCSWLFVPAYI